MKILTYQLNSPLRWQLINEIKSQTSSSVYYQFDNQRAIEFDVSFYVDINAQLSNDLTNL